jgi:hypothetical protein
MHTLRSPLVTSLRFLVPFPSFPPSFLADQAFRRDKTEAHVHVYVR